MNKNINEWKLDFPWGKVALVSWGDPVKPPVLLVHGYMDSAATFIPLLQYLPDDYYYVGFDMPGHGKSDPFPPGIMISQLNMVEVIRGIVEHMKWDSFMYLSHSMGFVIGAFYNHLFPGKITKMAHIDPALPTSMYYYSQKDPSYMYKFHQDTYYSNYDKFNGQNPKLLTKEEAINIAVTNRGFTEEQAEAILSRTLIPVGDKFRLSWDTRMKKIVTVSVSEETLYTIITKHSPTCLVIEASEKRTVSGGRRFAENLFEKCRLIVPGFYKIEVKGGHDVHITNPEIVAPYIKDFMNDKDLQTVSSKL